MNGTPSSERIHIGIFGSRNAGKSSLMNALTGQNRSVVSSVKGTTTDTVSKAMEILPLGPVVLMDAPGFDDEGELGSLRVEKCMKTLERADAALFAIDPSSPMSNDEKLFYSRIQNRNIPSIVVITKKDEVPDYGYGSSLPENVRVMHVSSRTGEGIKELKDAIGAFPIKDRQLPIAGDLIAPGDVVLLVIPIDKAAPKGRLILPQQQTIRDILDADGRVMITSVERVAECIADLRPKLVITDSQAFRPVSLSVPEDVLLTSFSILFARHKGNLEEAVKGIAAIKHLKDGDRILISEGCTHHRQCGDIGSEKIPKLLRKLTGLELCLEFSSGQGFPDDLSPYSLIIHCGGCMLTERDMQNRYRKADEQDVPITNYGLFIAYANGILERSLSVFPDYQKMLL